MSAKKCGICKKENFCRHTKEIHRVYPETWMDNYTVDMVTFGTLNNTVVGMGRPDMYYIDSENNWCRLEVNSICSDCFQKIFNKE